MQLKRSLSRFLLLYWLEMDNGFLSIAVKDEIVLFTAFTGYWVSYGHWRLCTSVSWSILLHVDKVLVYVVCPFGSSGWQERGAFRGNHLLHWARTLATAYLAPERAFARISRLQMYPFNLNWFFYLIVGLHCLGDRARLLTRRATNSFINVVHVRLRAFSRASSSKIVIVISACETLILCLYFTLEYNFWLFLWFLSWRLLSGTLQLYNLHLIWLSQLFSWFL